MPEIESKNPFDVDPSLTRREHATSLHIIGSEIPPPDGVIPGKIVVAGSLGTSDKPARADHTHELDTSILGGTPVSTGTANAAGSSTSAPKTDHVHAIGFSPSTAVVPVGSSLSEGLSAYPARVDHVHTVNIPSTKNWVINGFMQVAQRGTGAVTADQAFVVDRWHVTRYLSTYSGQATNFAMGELAHPNGGRYAAITVTTNGTAAAYTVFRQNIEHVWSLATKTVTVSWWAKATTSGKSMAVSFDQYFGTGGSPSPPAPGNGQKVALTTSWARYSLTFTIPSVSGKTSGSNSDHFLSLNMWLDAGSNFNASTASLGNQSGTFHIWGVMVTEGNTAPVDFEMPDYSLELLKCRRYYTRWTGSDSQHAFPSSSGKNTGSDAVQSVSILFENGVPWRAFPIMGHNLTDANYVASPPTGNKWCVGAVGLDWAVKSGSITFVTWVKSSFDGMMLGVIASTFFSLTCNFFGMGSLAYVEASAELVI